MKTHIFSILFIAMVSCTTNLEPVLKDTDVADPDTAELETSPTSCTGNPCAFNATCDDTTGEVKCVCGKGWEGDGITCSDVDECSLGLHNCNDPNGYCVNYEGGFSCGCNKGWRLSPDGVTCTEDFKYKQIAAANDVTCGLRLDGSVACWWYDSGETDTQIGPFQKISASDTFNFVCGLKSDGNIECWNYDIPGFSSSSDSPFIDFTVGYAYLCGLKRDETVECSDNSLPESLRDKKFVQIDAGESHSCGILNTGEAVCWGDNDAGQADVPDDIPQGVTFVQVAAELWHTCAVLSNHSIRCWGYTTFDSLKTSDAAFTQLVTHDDTICGLTTNGEVECWGDTTGTYASDGFLQIGMGEGRVCGLQLDGTIACFDGRRLGDEVISPSFFDGYYKQISVKRPTTICAIGMDETISCQVNDYPMPDTPTNSGYKQISASEEFACALHANGKVTCWGDTAPLPLDERFVQLSSGDDTACGVRADGAVICWGDKDFVPLDEQDAQGYMQVAVGSNHVCAIQKDKKPRCWGDNSYHQTEALSGEFDHISAEGNQTCGLRTDGSIGCWGIDNAYHPAFDIAEVDASGDYMCGIRSDDGRIVPSSDEENGLWSPDADFSHVSCTCVPGNYGCTAYVCGIRTDGIIVCWNG